MGEGVNLALDLLEKRKQEVRAKYLEAGADLVIDSISELPAAIEELNRRLAEEVR